MAWWTSKPEPRDTYGPERARARRIRRALARQVGLAAVMVVWTLAALWLVLWS